MKINKSILLLFLTPLFVACGYNISNPEDLIVGKYEVTSYSIIDCDDPAQNDPGSRLDFECFIENQYQICNSISLEFTTDRDYIFSRNTRTIDQGIGLVLNESDKTEGYFFISESDLRICFNGDCQEANYTFEGDQLSLYIQNANGCIEHIMANKL